MISVWLLKDLYERLYLIAFRNNVSIATYVRGIIIDAIIDEEEKNDKQTPTTTKR